ncbi:MAG: hypothetical protein ACT4P4_08255 [Betaproteobacteria bacterium]
MELIYARWLDAAAKSAFIASLAAFLVYALGVRPAFVPLDALPRLWSLPVDEYLRRTGAPSGWGWLAFTDRGEYLCLACLALLASVTLACYLRVLPALWRDGERLEAAIAAAQAAVLVAAASGVFAAAH